MDDYDKYLKSKIEKYVSRQIRTRLLKLGVGISKCQRCGEDIIWLKTKNGKQMPTTLELISHFANCPSADEFRK